MCLCLRTMCLPLSLQESPLTQRLPQWSPPGPSWLRDIMGPLPLPVHLSPLLFLLFSLVLLAHPCTSFRPQVVERAPDPEQPQSSGNGTGSGKRTCAGVVVCKPGIVLPVWLPLNPPLGEQTGRAVIYFACLMYMFLGVSIIADRFMASIEVITSQVLLNFIFIRNELSNFIWRKRVLGNSVCHYILLSLCHNSINPPPCWVLSKSVLVLFVEALEKIKLWWNCQEFIP